MSVWNILEISPTVDTNAIKKAYAAKLRIFHPEDDPEGFQRLREAYEQALKEAKYIKEVEAPGVVAEKVDYEQHGMAVPKEKAVSNQRTVAEETENGNSTSEEAADQFMRQVQAIYDDFFRRIDRSQWETLLDDKALWRLDVKTVVNQKILDFLLDHHYLPHDIWGLLNDHFFWSDREAELYNSYPNDFVNYLFEQVYSSWGLRYHGFKPDHSCDYDAFVQYREAAWQALIENELDQCARFLQQAQAIYNEDPDLIRLTGVYYKRVGDREKELLAFEQLIAVYPDDMDGFLGRADILLAKQDYANALKDYQQVLARVPDHVHALYGIARCYDSLQNTKEAKALYEQLVERSHGDIEVRMRLMEVNVRLSEQVLVELAAEPPEKKELLLQLGAIYFDLQMYTECRQIVSQMEACYYFCSDMYLLLGRVFMAEEEEECEQGIRCFDKALDLAKQEGANGYDILVQRGIAYQDEDPEKAIRDLSAALKINPFDPEVLVDLAEAYRLTEQNEKAIELATAAIAINPSRWVYYSTRGMAYYEVGHYEEAKADHEVVLAHEYYDEGAWYRKAYCHLQLSEFEAASEAFETGMEWENEMEPDARFYYALTLFKLNDIAKALKEIQLYRKTDDEEERYLLATNEMGCLEDGEIAVKRHLLIGDIYRAMDKWEQAAVEYCAGADLAPTEPALVKMAAYCHLRLGSFEEANDYLEQFYDLNSDDAWGLLHLTWANMELGEWKNAEEYVRGYFAAVQKASQASEPFATFYYGRILYQRGSYEQAATYLEQACRDGLGQYARSDLSLAYYELGDMEKALALAKMALDEEPDNIDYQTRYRGIMENQNKKSVWSFFKTKPSSRKVWPATLPMKHHELSTMPELNIPIGGECNA